MRTKPTLTLAFIDSIACALGAVLLILFSVLNEQQAERESARVLRKERDAAVVRRDQLESQFADAKAQKHHLEKKVEAADAKNQHLTNQIRNWANEIAQLKNEVENSQDKLRQLTDQNQRMAVENEALGKLQQRQAREVIGLNGQFKRVAFVFDTSGSLKEGFAEHKALLSLWLRRLDFEHFNVISFADQPSPWTAGWEKASDGARTSAAEHVAAFQADGNTATRAALLNALQLPDIDTIVFFSDGAPSDGPTAEILDELRKTNQHKVVINVVAIGDYFDTVWGTFSRDLAQEHGGQFVGR